MDPIGNSITTTNAKEKMEEEKIRQCDKINNSITDINANGQLTGN